MIEKLIIEGFAYTPTIILDPVENVISIEGESYHEHVSQIFEPVFKWLDEYLKTDHDVTLNFKTVYFNTSSSRVFLEILLILQTYQEKTENKVVVNWYYQEDDLDILEMGEEYAEEITLPFNYISY